MALMDPSDIVCLDSVCANNVSDSDAIWPTQFSESAEIFLQSGANGSIIKGQQQIQSATLQTLSN